MAITEQIEFGKRLTGVMETCGMKSSPTVLARVFNAKTEEPVTVHAARKWIMGQAIPTQSRMLTLAGLLGADVNWLRFGAGSKPKVEQLDIERLELIGAIGKLAPRERRAVLAFVRVLVPAGAA